MGLPRRGSMRRQLVLGVLMAMGAVSIGVSALQQPAGRRPAGGARRRGGQAEGQPLHDARRGGGNSAVFIMTDGVTVVDTKNPGWGQPLLDKIKSVTDKPITADHQHPHARRSRERQRRVPGHGGSGDAREHREEHAGDEDPHRHHAGGRARPVNIFKDNNGRGLPKRTFKDKMLDRQGRRPGRPLLLRPRPHQRRRVGRVSGAAR